MDWKKIFLIIHVEELILQSLSLNNSILLKLECFVFFLFFLRNLPVVCEWVSVSVIFDTTDLYLRMLTEIEEKATMDVNASGCYNTMCVELDMASLAVNTLIQVTD